MKGNLYLVHHKTDKRTKITFKRLFCYNYKEALKMKLLIYLLLLLTMPLAAQGKTDEKTLKSATYRV